MQMYITSQPYLRGKLEILIDPIVKLVAILASDLQYSDTQYRGCTPADTIRKGPLSGVLEVVSTKFNNKMY